MTEKARSRWIRPLSVACTVPLVVGGLGVAGASVAAAAEQSFIYSEDTRPTIDPDSFVNANYVVSPALSGGTVITEPGVGVVDSMTFGFNVDLVDDEAANAADIRSVALCLYLAESGDPTCANSNGRDTARIIATSATGAWTAETTTYAGPSGWGIAGTSVAVEEVAVDTDALVAEFEVVPSAVMREAAASAGDSWAASAIVTSQGGLTNSDQDYEGDVQITVNFFASVANGAAAGSRPSSAFGMLNAEVGGNSGVSPVMTVGQLITNGVANVNMTITDFNQVGGANTLTNIIGTEPSPTNPAGPADLDEFSFDCTPGGPFSQTAGGTVRIPTANAVAVNANVTPTGTPLPGVADVTAACRLAIGEVDGVNPEGTYRATLTVATSQGTAEN